MPPKLRQATPDDRGKLGTPIMPEIDPNTGGPGVCGRFRTTLTALESSK